MRALAGLLLATLAAGPARADAPAEEPLLWVVPLGNPSPDLVATVVRAVSATFRFKVEVAPPMELPAEAYYAPRKRWRAEKLLDALDAVAPERAWRVAAITEQPISTTKDEIYDWGIAGLGSMGGKSSVFSSYIFKRFEKSDRRTYLRFMDNLVLHEVGHTLGLPHCPFERCIMADAKGNAVRAARVSINELCPRCYAQIRQHLRQDGLRGDWSKEQAVIDAQNHR